MKVLQALPRMDIGGVERGVLDQAKYLKDKESQCLVLSGGGRLVDELKKYGAIHWRLPVYKKSPLALLLIPRLARLIRKEGLDIVHARSRVPAWISFFATRGTAAHFITTAHGVYGNRFSSEVMGWGKFVICPSGLVARHMHQNFGVPQEKIVIINRWVDLDRFKFSDYELRKSNNVIVTIGRIAPNKGYEYLIEAFKRVVRFNPYFTLKIVGSADKSKTGYLSELKTLVNRYALNYNVKFVGFKADVERVLVEARLLVAPSVADESFGRVLIEAMASGVPVVATRVGGFSEIIEDSVNGMLVAPKSASSLAKAVLALLGDTAAARRLSLAARKKVEEHYTLTACAGQIEAVYQKAIGWERIAVIKISSLGDLILIIPALKMIKEGRPQSQITLVTLKKYSSLFAGSPYVDNVIGLDPDYKKLKNIRQIARRLRRQGFDYIVDFQNSRASHLISFLSLARQSFGFSRKWGFLLSRRARFPEKGRVDPLTSQERITSFLGLKFKEKRLSFWPLPEHDISSLGLPAGKLIGINVAASPRWSSKNWPQENLQRLVEMIYKAWPELGVVLLGDEGCVPYAQELMDSLNYKPVNLCGKTTLPDLIEVLKRLSAFITPDTATLHLAQALGVQTIALFGPTNPEGHTVPAANLHLFFKELPCSFCYKPQCKDPQCLSQIAPAEIFAKLKQLL